ncbi:Uncharacterised protein [BD1-7 clade bacterium]|uniref:Uncharacterized protein n=1 Tax=BD1-7 clade bacterium TaxID=2029982 RepID=A0A5S9QIK9_9GAMM|nr:Uncharacterised protein [BD1-7 clade bacterium]
MFCGQQRERKLSWGGRGSRQTVRYDLADAYDRTATFFLFCFNRVNGLSSDRRLSENGGSNNLI